MEPKKTYFPGQKENEEIVLFIRRHWITFVPTLLITLMIIVVPVVVMTLIIRGFHVELSSVIYNYIILALSAFILFVLTFLIISWISYYFDVLIVTDERLVNIEQDGLFNRHISQLDLLRVQNVSTSVKGMFATFFNYGILDVQTAGDNSKKKENLSDFTMEAMPNPQKIAETILDYNQRLIKKHAQEEAMTHGEGEIHPHNKSYPEEKPDGLTSTGHNTPDQETMEMNSDGSAETAESSGNFSDGAENIQIDKGNAIDWLGQARDGETIAGQTASATKSAEGQLKEGETIDL